MRNHATIAVIIPAFDEADAIGKVVSAIPDWVDDVVVADNGSRDATRQVAQAQGARVVFEPERGYGSACLAGIDALDHPDVVVFLDGDYSDRPEEMASLVDPIISDHADMVIGSRVLGRREPGALTTQARFGNWLACNLMRLFWSVKYTDLGPFRAIRFTALNALAMRDRDYGWTVEMQVKAALHRLRAREVPVSYRRRIGMSKISGTLRGMLGAGTKILSTIFLAALRSRRPTQTKTAGRRLVLFTRFPEPGKTKTRLTPKLGQTGAAELQRRMTAHTLAWAHHFTRLQPTDIEVRFQGGGADAMRNCFGPQFRYVPQGEGDLGDRMARAFDSGFRAGMDAVVIIGTDCPDLTAERLEEAFEALRSNEMVLGPATDGGYYLIGLCRPIPDLFAGLPWGTAHVLQQTLDIARENGLRPEMLDPLDDVDRPQDLPVWERASANRPPCSPVERISMIIPTLNEAEYLPQALADFGPSSDLEIIVADGGSCDGTAELARSLGATVITAPTGRAAQMNAAAQIATGHALFFLHADTCLNAGALDAIRQTFAEPGTVGGTFTANIDSSKLALRIVTWGIKLRNRLLRSPYGDQGLFVRAEVFHEMGCFRPLPIMEDVDFVRRLRKRGRLAILGERIRISDRRWIANGVIRTTLVNWTAALLFACRVSPHTIRRLHDKSLRSGKPGTKTQDNTRPPRQIESQTRAKETEPVKTGAGYG